MKYDIYICKKHESEVLVLVKSGTKASSVKDRFPKAKKVGSCNRIVIYNLQNVISVDDPVKV